MSLLAAAAAGVESSVVSMLISAGPPGVFLLMVLFRFKIMPTYVYEDAKREWDRERSRLEGELGDLRAAVAEAQGFYAETVIPTLTRVLDAEKELVDIRRTEQESRRRRD